MNGLLSGWLTACLSTFQ